MTVHISGDESPMLCLVHDAEEWPRLEQQPQQCHRNPANHRQSLVNPDLIAARSCNHLLEPQGQFRHRFV